MARETINVDELYRRWHEPVRTWIRRRRNVPPLWVEDIAQEVFMRLMRYDPQIETNTPGYVFRIASNVANEWTKRSHLSKDHSSLEDTNEHQLGVIFSPEQILEDQQEERERLLKIELAMSKLNERRLLVLMMHMYDQKTYGQIAKELGLTYRIVLRDLTKAYTFLRVELRDMVEVYTTDEESDDERTDGKTGKGRLDGGNAGLRPAAPHVGVAAGVLDAGAANGPILDGGAIERSVAGG